MAYKQVRIHLLSDLHLEFEGFQFPDVTADVRILAGDIDIKTRGLEFAIEESSIPTIYVAGNHEYYGGALPKLTHLLQEIASNSQVHFLENAVAKFGDLRILGCTLWTDFSVLGEKFRDAAMIEAKQVMNDFRKIRESPSYRRLRPSTTRSLHLTSLNWLKKELEKPWSGQTMVVTHHAPSARSFDPAYNLDLLAGAYGSSLDEVIASYPIDLWAHGHTHFCVDYCIGDTRIVSNQRGYPDAPAIGFQEGLVLSL